MVSNHNLFMFARCWNEFGKILERSWKSLEICCNDLEGLGTMLDRYWKYVGKMLEKFWTDFGTIFELFWTYFVKALERFRNEVGKQMNWNDFERVLKPFWHILKGVVNILETTARFRNVFGNYLKSFEGDGVCFWVR